ncbi:hypothetical protein KJQ99_06310 [Campylobacter sp. 2018MI13]|nr:hypothetical protein [Campylobacter sp. 2018MI13]
MDADGNLTNTALNLARTITGGTFPTIDTALTNAIGAATNVDDLKTALTNIKNELTKQQGALDATKLSGKFGDGQGTATQDNIDEAQKAIGLFDAIAQVDGMLSAVKKATDIVKRDGMSNIVGLSENNSVNFGRLSLVSNNGKDIQVEAKNTAGVDVTAAIGYDKDVSEKTVSLRETNSTIDKDLADAMGFNSEEWMNTGKTIDGIETEVDHTNGYAAGVMTLKGAQAMMNIAESAQKALEAIRSDLGSVQNQLVSTVNNISVTQVNVKSAESNIRDVDFASESATFSKHQILAQSGVYAMSQANAVQQNVMRLLQ